MDARQLLALLPAAWRGPLAALLDRMDASERRADELQRRIAALESRAP